MTVEVKLTFASIDEATAFFAGKQAPTSTPAPAPTKPAKTAPAADTKPPAAPQPSPAQEQKDPASAKPSPDTKQPEAEKPKAETPTYEKSGIGEKIANYLGDKNSEGYGDRRAKIVGLLAEFNVKSGKELKPEQFGDFTTKLNAVTAPGEDLS